MIKPFWYWRARVSYLLARRLYRWSWLVEKPRGWHWLEGQYSQMAYLGDHDAESFYGHILVFRGDGQGARDEGARLMRLAALGGHGKAAYQLGVMSLAGDLRKGPDALEAAQWWEIAVKAGHPLAPIKLSQLFTLGGPGLPADPERAKPLEGLGKPHGF